MNGKHIAKGFLQSNKKSESNSKVKRVETLTKSTVVEI